jgi:hypothetical protein
VYFYELHETDDDLFTDIVLVHDNEFDEDEFLEQVLEARLAVLEKFEEDSLVEAVANELARVHGFTVIDDSRLRVAVNVSVEEGATVLATTDERAAARDAGDSEDEEYRSLLIEVDPEDPR